MSRESARDAAPTVLRVWLDAKRVKQKELARRCGVSAAHIGNICTGRFRCPLALKLAISVVTIEIETELGIAVPVGLPVSAWPVEDLEQAEAAS